MLRSATWSSLSLRSALMRPGVVSSALDPPNGGLAVKSQQPTVFDVGVERRPVHRSVACDARTDGAVATMDEASLIADEAHASGVHLP
jgi:hypothetical protein